MNLSFSKYHMVNLTPIVSYTIHTGYKRCMYEVPSYVCSYTCYLERPSPSFLQCSIKLNMKYKHKRLKKLSVLIENINSFTFELLLFFTSVLCLCLGTWFRLMNKIERDVWGWWILLDEIQIECVRLCFTKLK